MSGKHVCQLRDGEKVGLLLELRDVVRRLDAIEQPSLSQTKYELNNLPNFLREKVPKFKKNLDLVPLITHTAADEVIFTSDANIARNGSEDPHKTFALIPGPGSPFKPAYATSDKLCDDFCNRALNAEQLRLGKKLPAQAGGFLQPICLRQEPRDAPRDIQGNMYECNHDRKYESIMVCNSKDGKQSYLCTRHVDHR